MGSGPVAGRDSWVPLSWTKGFFNRSCSAAIAHPDGLGAPLDILIERTFTRTIVLVSVGAPTVRRQERGGVCRCLLLRRCPPATTPRLEEHTSELQSRFELVCRLLLEKKEQNPRGNGLASQR